MSNNPLTPYNNNNNQSMPYNSGRGFQKEKVAPFGKGGFGIRKGEWGALPNATGEILRGVSADYDWRHYTARSVAHVPSQGTQQQRRSREGGGGGGTPIVITGNNFGDTHIYGSQPASTSSILPADVPKPQNDIPTFDASRESVGNNLSRPLFADTTPTEGYQGYTAPKDMGARSSSWPG